MTLYSFIGIACTSASTVVFGEPIWNPITLLGRFHQPLRRLPRAHRHPHRHPQRQHRRQRRRPLERLLQPRPALISFRTGGLITGLLGLAMMPWRLMASHHQLHSAGWSATPACSARSPASWSRTTSSSAAPASTSPPSTTANLYDYAWFVGFFVAAAVYYALMLTSPVAAPDAQRSCRLKGLSYQKPFLRFGFWSQPFPRVL